MGYDRNYEDEWYWYARFYVNRGFSVIPCGQNKRPLIEWEQYQRKRAGMREVREWERQGLGIVTGEISGIVVVDCDTEKDARWWYDNHDSTPYVVQTRRGFHFYYKHPGEPIRNGQKVNGRYDVRGDGGYVIAPPSWHSEGCYYKWRRSWVNTKDMPTFNPLWRTSDEDRASPQPTQTPARREPTERRKIHDAKRYIMTIRAVSGKNGHNDTFRAANRLYDSGMSEAEALLALMEWNRTNADPPWTEQELLHKIRCVYAR